MYLNAINLNKCNSQAVNMKKTLGIVYTPTFLADFVAQKTLEFFLKDKAHSNGCLDFNKIRIIDPACGDGELLLAIWKQIQPLKTFTSKPLNPIDILCGIDIDCNAVNKTRARLANETSNTIGFEHSKIIKANALWPVEKVSTANGWQQIKNLFDASSGFDILIANPPWGTDMSLFCNNLRYDEFALHKGQFDSSDLFIELALSIVKPGGYFAFIIPDSLFTIERRQLREMLLRQTDIKFIARLGEGIFKDINRGCVVLICSINKDTTKNETECLRLTPYLREKILRAELNLRDAERQISHKVSQDRFLANTDFNIDIDVREYEEMTLARLKKQPDHLRRYLVSARGIELSKTGKVIKCGKCKIWMPLPTGQKPKCLHCDAVINLKTCLHSTIVSNERVRGSKRILVGESIKRYFTLEPKWILTDKKGINYKDNKVYQGSKILIRKTGVGISAAIDYTGALTNQVVYIFKLKDEKNSWLTLEFLLALINSRAIYYYIVKSHGETEWRSHPYVTQKQILDLPVPNIEKEDREKRKIVQKISNLVKPFLKRNVQLSDRADAQIEFYICKLFGLTKNDYKVIYNTLNQVEGLLPVKALRKVKVEDIFGNYI
jgi:hypothetical protein